MLTPEQRITRRNFLGSSDAPAILGLDSYRSAYDVWAEKTGLLPDEERTESDAIMAGNYFETGLLRWAEDRLRTEFPFVLRDGKWWDPGVEYHHTNGIMVAHLDAQTKPQASCDEPWLRIVEAKTAGLFNPFANLETWGEEGTDEVPERVIVQVHHQAACMRSAGKIVHKAHVPAALGDRGFSLFHVEISDELVSDLERIELEFWKRVVARVPPENSAPSLDVVKKIRRIEGAEIDLDGTLVLDWREADQRKKEAEKEADRLKALVLASLGEAEIGRIDGGLVTYFQQARSGYVVQPTEFRVARYKDLAKAKGRKK